VAVVALAPAAAAVAAVVGLIEDEKEPTEPLLDIEVFTAEVEEEDTNTGTLAGRDIAPDPAAA
jgi:hypothetical protein